MITSEHEQKKGDVVLLLLLLFAVLTLPLSVKDSGWVPEANRLIYVTLWSALVGMLVARSRLPAWVAWVFALALGVEYSIQFAGKLLPSGGVVLSDLGHAVNWLWSLVAGRSPGGGLPFFRSVSHVAAQVGSMVDNVTLWVTATQEGGASEDNTVLWFGVSLVIWLLTWNASFELHRRKRTFVALLPLGIGLLSNVSFTDIGMDYLYYYMAATLLTLVWANIGRMESFWARLGLDFSPELKRDAALAGFLLSSTVFVIALIMPYRTYNRAVFYFWDRLGPKFEAFYEQLDRAFSGRNPVPEPTPGPRDLAAHTITSGSVPNTDIVLYVTTSDPPPPTEDEAEMMGYDRFEAQALVPQHYWRERTYDVYTGHGWDSSERDSGEFSGNGFWQQPNYSHVVLTQTFEIADPSWGLAYAVNEPVTLDRDYQVLARGEGDFAALSVDSDTYTVVSWVADATVEELQSAEGEYPDWIGERYLSLPKIPDRVVRTAEEIVRQAGAVTRYEKARAIEASIREFAYDLDLEPPPLDADVVDYFLFDAQRGYCDYSATAMVVMLRSLGVAARYASGFGMGVYDQAQGHWVVIGDNAHAWAEVYFPGRGWIEFEPTPIQRVFLRAESRVGSAAPVPALEPEEARQRIPAVVLWGAGLLMVVLFAIVWPPRWFRRSRHDYRWVVCGVYDKLVRRARWLGLEPEGGQTPREYLAGLASEMERRAEFSRGAGEDIASIQRAYQVARYSDREMSAEDSHRTVAAWLRLRGKLFRLIFVRAPRRSEI